MFCAGRLVIRGTGLLACLRVQYVSSNVPSEFRHGGLTVPDEILQLLYCRHVCRITLILGSLFVTSSLYGESERVVGLRRGEEGQGLQLQNLGSAERHSGDEKNRQCWPSDFDGSANFAVRKTLTLKW